MYFEKKKQTFQTDILGLIIACISHDIDHRGTNNDFQKKTNNPLAKLYSTSTLERHHLNQCLFILTLSGNQILDNLTKEEYTDVLAVIERSILATDLALHFKDASALSTLADKVQHQSPESLVQHLKSNFQAKALLQAAMMSSADLGASTKPWDVHHYVSLLVVHEFWMQGDIERQELNIQPQPMLDRSVALEGGQIGFLDHICIPLYKDMTKFSSELMPLLEGCLANRCQWVHAREKSSSERDQGI